MLFIILLVGKLVYFFSVYEPYELTPCEGGKLVGLHFFEVMFTLYGDFKGENWNNQINLWGQVPFLVDLVLFLLLLFLIKDTFLQGRLSKHCLKPNPVQN